MIIATCPGCGRDVYAYNKRFSRHPATRWDRGQGDCFMSDQHIPIEGHTDAELEERCRVVLDLAMQVQDMDVSIVWNVITAMNSRQLQELLMIALAAVPFEDKRIEDVWAWVTTLPDALAAAS